MKIAFLLLSLGAPLNIPVVTGAMIALGVMHVVTAVAIVAMLTRLGTGRVAYGRVG
jgi:hypothetical protein